MMAPQPAISVNMERHIHQTTERLTVRVNLFSLLTGLKLPLTDTLGSSQIAFTLALSLLTSFLSVLFSPYVFCLPTLSYSSVLFLSAFIAFSSFVWLEFCFLCFFFAYSFSPQSNYQNLVVSGE